VAAEDENMVVVAAAKRNWAQRGLEREIHLGHQVELERKSDGAAARVTVTKADCRQLLDGGQGKITPVCDETEQSTAHPATQPVDNGSEV
jgi:hypothetical protein